MARQKPDVSIRFFEPTNQQSSDILLLTEYVGWIRIALMPERVAVRFFTIDLTPEN